MYTIDAYTFTIDMFYNILAIKITHQHFNVLVIKLYYMHG